jgi:membrane-bound lytic murein transglycosylase D
MDLEWDEPLLWRRIPLKGQISLPLLAGKTGIDGKLLSRGNAELFYGVTPPSEGIYLLKVPAKEADIVKRVILTHEREQLMKYTVHSIGAGDTLYALSEHFGVPVSLVLQSNPGVVPEKLRVGERILIPLVKDVGPFPGRPERAAEMVETDLSSFNATHTVGSGETLWAIAKRYGTTPEALAAGNGLAMTDTIFPGHILKVPDAARPFREEEIRRQ